MESNANAEGATAAPANLTQAPATKEAPVLAGKERPVLAPSPATAKTPPVPMAKPAAMKTPKPKTPKAKAKKAKKPVAKVAKKGKGKTAATSTNAEIKRIASSYKRGKFGFCRMEKKFGLRPANGMTALRFVQKAKKLKLI